MGRSCGSYFHGGFCFDAEVKGLELASHIGQAMQVHHLNLHIIKSWQRWQQEEIRQGTLGTGQ
jgi:hypothetical protein